MAADVFGTVTLTPLPASWGKSHGCPLWPPRMPHPCPFWAVTRRHWVNGGLMWANAISQADEEIVDVQPL